MWTHSLSLRASSVEPRAFSTSTIPFMHFLPANRSVVTRRDKPAVHLCFSVTLPLSGHTYHFFSGMGRGTAFTRQGKLGWPDRFLPRIVPTRFSGRITKKQIQQTATCRRQKALSSSGSSGMFSTYSNVSIVSLELLVPTRSCGTTFICCQLQASDEPN